MAPLLHDSDDEIEEEEGRAGRGGKYYYNYYKYIFLTASRSSKLYSARDCGYMKSVKLETNLTQ